MAVVVPARLFVLRMLRVVRLNPLQRGASSVVEVNQILARMGAKVEGDNYMLGYYAMGDFNMDANGRWSPYHDEKMSNGHMCNGFMTKPANGYSEYDKEMLTRTMLEHEAIFRQQVYELHRVYKIQRDLMKQYQNKDIYAYPMLEDASKTNSPSQLPPNGAKMSWPIQTPPMSITYKKASIAEHGVMNHPLKFLREGSVQSSPNGFPPSDVALNARQGTFDLQLSADHYVDDDNASDNGPIDFLGVAPDKKPQNNADLTLVSPEGLGRFSDNSSTSGLHATNNVGGRQVVDLNEPITGTYMGRANGSVSRGLSYTLENSWHQSILRPSTANFNYNKEYSKEKHLDEGTSSNFFAANAKTRQEEKQLIDKGKQVSSIHVFTPRYIDANPQMSMKGVDGRSGSNNQFFHQGQNGSIGWFARSPLEAPAINNFPRLDRSHNSSLGALAPPMSIPHIDHPSGASPIGSCTVDPRSSAINNATFQPIPSFKGSSTVNQSIGTSILKVKKNEDLDGNCPGFALDPFCASRPQHQVAISSDEEQTECLMFEHSARHRENPHFANDKGPKNFNLNEALSDGQEDCLVEQDGGSVSSLPQSKASGFPWLIKTTDTYTRPSDLQNPRKVFAHSNRIVIDLNSNTDRKEVALTIHSLSDSASTSLDCGVKKESQDCGIKKDEAFGDITTRTEVACNTTQESATCLPVLCQEYVPGDDKAANGGDKKSSAPVRNFIDLNDDAPNEDNSESSVVSHECHVVSLQNNHGKRKFVIDLEVPACEEGVAWDFNQECSPSGKLDVTQEADDAHFTCTKIAAESIVALSMHVTTIAETPDDMLQWFADLAVSSTDDHVEQAEAHDCVNNSSDDGLDSFESLTLKLEETKIDEYWSRPQAPEIPNDEQAGLSVNLLTKPKRGQQRRRRQKRDFQKDILPGLTSLARPEIIEDIQLLEGLVQASGGSWQSSLTRRGRYGGRPRGRKPRKNLSETIEEEEVPVSPPAKPDTAKPDAAEIEASDRGIIGWGRTTRRCRRPRCPSGYNISAAS
uniref:Uncharacterized protein n=1 Tax=Oryza meridionalis TaxID=40149 RepID=A0A0E0D723_9ORYZ